MTTATPHAAPRMPGIAREFLAGDELVPFTHEGRAGIRIMVRLTDYRSLPLSCIAGIDLAIDGTTVDPDQLVLILNGRAHPLPALRDRMELTWFVLDPAQLFIPLEAPLAAGAHDVEGTLHLVMPYATVGRVVRASSSRVRLPLAEPVPVWS